MTQRQHDNVSNALLCIVFFILLLCLVQAASSQTCTQAMTLRTEACPSGITSCTSKGSTLTWIELDRDIVNTANLCNGPGKFTWPAAGVAGIFAVSSGGVVSVAVDDDAPDAGDYGSLALTGDVTSSGLATTISSNSVALSTDTTGNYAAGDAEAGNATGLACTTCVDASDISNDAITEAKLKVVDSPADEECFTYESTTGDFEWQTCGGSGAVDLLAVSDYIDDFRGGSTEAGEVGDNGWIATGTVAYIAGEANHPGIIRMTTAATNGTAQYLHPATVTTIPWLVTDISEARVVFRIGAVTAVSFSCGFMTDHSNTGSGGGESIRLNFDSSASANFRTITKNSGGTTTTGTSTAAAANTWYLARYVRNGSGNWEFYLNGTLLNTHTTNLATGAVGFSCNSTPLENVAKTWDIDYIQVTTKTLGNRY